VRISQQMLFQLQMDKYFYNLICFIKELGQLLMLVYQLVEWDQLRRPKQWNQLHQIWNC